MSTSDQKSSHSASQGSNPPSELPPANLKDKIEKLTNSNPYCWTVIVAATLAIIMQFLYHEGEKYSDKFFLVLAIMLLAIGININQLRKNYRKKKQGGY